MIKKQVIILIVVTMLVFSSGCSQQSTEAPALIVDLSSFPAFSQTDINDVNQNIQLRLFSPSVTNLKSNQVIVLIVENLSSESIEFPLDWGIKIYTYRDSNAVWQEVENRSNYSGEAVTLTPQGAESGIYSFPISVLPTLSDSDEYLVRIFVSGRIQSSNEVVIAYIDLQIQSK